jgi:hypothetical protein
MAAHTFSTEIQTPSGSNLGSTSTNTPQPQPTHPNPQPLPMSSPKYRPGSTNRITVTSVREDPCTITGDTPENMCRYWHEIIATQPDHEPDKESVVVVMLNTRLRPYAWHRVSLGTVNESPASPREVFRPVITAGAYGFVITRPSIGRSQPQPGGRGHHPPDCGGRDPSANQVLRSRRHRRTGSRTRALLLLPRSRTGSLTPTDDEYQYLA